ncbi:hypothetical protein YTPLAS21_12370 [Candidatus Nitrosocosmicus sp.]|jgi:hypothetical protein|nr:hypothetical protein YTPLAS21_12370 [Candidatus Nitrosocosmicus sp.]
MEMAYAYKKGVHLYKNLSGGYKQKDLIIINGRSNHGINPINRKNDFLILVV